MLVYEFHCIVAKLVPSIFILKSLIAIFISNYHTTAVRNGSVLFSLLAFKTKDFLYLYII